MKKILKNDILIKLLAIIISVLFIVVGVLIQKDILITSNQSLYIKIVFGLAFLIGGFAKAIEGLEKTIKNKALNVEFLMIIAALGAFILGEYMEATILIFIFAVSGLLEDYVASKSEKTLTNLLKLTPQQALLVKDDIEYEVDAQTLNIGDIVAVKVGMLIPADGIVVKGETNVDQAIITGESEPVYKKIGLEVFAGSTNILSNVLIEVTVNPKQSLAEKIVNFVKEAQESKTKEETLINKIEKYYVYIILLVGILTMFIPPLFGWWASSKAIKIGITVFVVASPCALVASITPAILSSMSYAVKNQVLVKGGTPLSNLNKMDVAIFDKTGTITQGMPQFVEVKIDKSYNKEDVLKKVVSIESQSTHPLAVAITSYYKDMIVNNNLSTKEIAGSGMEVLIDDELWQIGKFKYTKNLVENEIKKAKQLSYSIVYIIVNKIVIGYIALKDEVKANAYEVIQYLNTKGIETVLLTGDHEDIAKEIAKELNFSSYIADILPLEKSLEVERYQNKGKQVLMIGDGINDAPALSIANVSIAMGTGADVSMNAADIVIIDSELNMIPNLYELSNKLKNITRQNVILSLLVITTLLVFNYLDMLELPIGVIAHEVSTIIVILNGLRLLFNKNYLKAK